MAEENENPTIKEITATYEEKIANREKEFLKEKEDLKKEMKAEFEKEKQTLQAQHNKDIADIIMGRKSAEQVQKSDEENDKSFFDKTVEETRKKLGITKEEKK